MPAHIILLLGPVLLFFSSDVATFQCPDSCVCQQKTINCSKYNLTPLASVPDFIKTHGNPNSIDLSGNDIEEIKSTNFQSRKLESLQYLYLNDNMVRYIEENAFAALPELKLLELSYNFLEEVPSNIVEQNPHIQTLNLSGNYFSTKTPQLVSSSLEVLDLSLCNITTFTDVNIEDLSNLQVLFLHANYLKHIDITISKIFNLRHVSLSYNLWKCDVATKQVFDFLLKENLVILHKSMPSCIVKHGKDVRRNRRN